MECSSRRRHTHTLAVLADCGDSLDPGLRAVRVYEREVRHGDNLWFGDIPVGAVVIGLVVDGIVIDEDRVEIPVGQTFTVHCGRDCFTVGNVEEDDGPE